MQHLIDLLTALTLGLKRQHAVMKRERTWEPGSPSAILNSIRHTPTRFWGTHTYFLNASDNQMREQG